MQTPAPPQRIASVDVYRGFVMLLMMAEVLEFCHVSEALPNSTFWHLLCYHQSHVEWVGCSLHDLIQPSFSFLVGVALPYSIASRVSKGQAATQLFWHTLWRSFVLIALGILLRSMFKSQLNFTFEDTLTQIGLGYPFLYILGSRSFNIQLSALVIILVGYWLVFALYPLPDANFNYTLAGVSPTWEHNLTGFTAHWNKNTNLAWAFDRWFLNLFPREKVFIHNGGGYATLSFIPTLGTMILGLLAGQWLKANSNANIKLRQFLITGISLLFVGVLLDWSGVCPNVKRIWTPTWTLFSGGWCFVLLAGFYWLIDLQRQGRWFVWMKVVGMNSITAYISAHTLVYVIGWVIVQLFGSDFNKVFGEAYADLVHGMLLLLPQWLLLYWMYRQKLFIRI